MKIFIILSFVSLCLYAQPPRHIPPELLAPFTLDKTVSVLDRYMDNTAPEPTYQTTLPDGTRAAFYPKKTLDHFIGCVKRGESAYYGETDRWLYEMLKRYPIAGKEVAIIGSATPWYESVVLAYGGRPVTIEYNKIATDDVRLTLMTVEEFNQNPRKFDLILSISSIEHDGLGRYGDPINPTADLEFMQMAKETLLKEGGAMILAMPVGRDCLCWNACRIYGPRRLPLLFEGWQVVDSVGFTEAAFSRGLGDWGYQPVFYLIPIMQKI
jgi:hypothetical protein